MESTCEYARKYSKDVSLHELRDRLAEFAEVRGWDQFHSPRNLLLALVSPEATLITQISLSLCSFFYFFYFYYYASGEPLECC